MNKKIAWRNCKILKFQNLPVKFWEISKSQISKVPKFQNSKLPKKSSQFFGNSNSQFPFGILEFGNFQKIDWIFWNFGIMEFWNFRILEFWNIARLVLGGGVSIYIYIYIEISL